jgi:hypothetical protein
LKPVILRGDYRPDVLWHDSLSGYSIAFELKTKKEDPALYFKKEVGQVMNHIGWMKDNRAEDKFDGVIIVGPGGKCDPLATPVDEVYLCETGRVIEKVEMFIAKVDDFRGRISAERDLIIKEFGSLPEWQIQGWFASFGFKRLKELR